MKSSIPGFAKPAVVIVYERGERKVQFISIGIHPGPAHGCVCRVARFGLFEAKK